VIGKGGRRSYYTRESYVAILRSRRDHEEIKRLVSESIVRNRGNLVAVAHDLGFNNYQTANTYVIRYNLWGIVRGARKRAEAPPAWLVRTLAVIEGGRMEAISQLYEAAAGMSVEDIAAEIEASVHAGMVDARALAEALSIGGDAMAEAGG